MPLAPPAPPTLFCPSEHITVVAPPAVVVTAAAPSRDAWAGYAMSVRVPADPFAPAPPRISTRRKVTPEELTARTAMLLGAPAPGPTKERSEMFNP